MTPTSKTAIYPGSFNPFTLGHLSIVERGLKVFDKIVVAVGCNECKSRRGDDFSGRVESIRRVFEDEPRVEVITYSGLTADEAVRLGACAILRGVRSVADFETERQMADVNRDLCGIDTYILCSLPEYGFLSGSMVRELEHFGADVSKYLPKEKTK